MSRRRKARLWMRLSLGAGGVLGKLAKHRSDDGPQLAGVRRQPFRVRVVSTGARRRKSRSRSQGVSGSGKRPRRWGRGARHRRPRLRAGRRS